MAVGSVKEVAMGISFEMISSNGEEEHGTDKRGEKARWDHC